MKISFQPTAHQQQTSEDHSRKRQDFSPLCAAASHIQPDLHHGSTRDMTYSTIAVYSKVGILDDTWWHANRNVNNSCKSCKNSTCSARADCGGAAKFRRQWTDHLEHYVTCPTSARVVTECLHTYTEDAPVLDRPAPLRRFYALPVPNINAPTYLLTSLHVLTSAFMHSFIH